jgi:hypothetical protein
MTIERRRPDPKRRPLARGPNPAAMQFFGVLKWIDGKPLLDTIEPYRRDLLSTALDKATYNFVLSGRGKKNWKSADLILAALYCLLMRDSAHGNQCLVVANDLDQANDDLDLAKKLVRANPDLQAELTIRQTEIVRKDKRGFLQILPGRDVAGAHGKTFSFLGFDEVHERKDYDIFEALARDPTRPDALTWITSYDTIFNQPGIPLYDWKQLGRSGEDPRLLFSWYSGDLCTDPNFVDLEPELRANPSIGSWPEGRDYLDQQRRRLPSHKFRRLHLNLPGSPEGAFFDQAMVMAAIDRGRRQCEYDPKLRYAAFVDMSGGSSDDACLAIAHKLPNGTVIIDLVVNQGWPVPFDAIRAVSKFAEILRQWNVTQVYGDDYAGHTFKLAFERQGIRWGLPREMHKADRKDTDRKLDKTDLYERLEPQVNGEQIRLPDIPKLEEQLLTLVVKGQRIDHQDGDHDDWANAVAGAAWVAADAKKGPLVIPDADYASIHNRMVTAPYRRPTTSWRSRQHLGVRSFFGTGNER